MHDIKVIEQEEERIKKNLQKRGIGMDVIDQSLHLNLSRKKLIKEVQEIQALINKKSKETGLLKRQGHDITSEVQKIHETKNFLEKKNKQLSAKKEDLNNLLSTLPNLIDDDVPLGQSEKDNVEIDRWGKIPEFDFIPRDHVDLGEKLGMLDFLSASKLSGSRFVVYRKHLARLERVLIDYMIDFNTKRGHEEIMPPYIVNDEVLYGTGQLPKFSDDLFKLEGRNWYLIPTAEVPLTNLKRKELFSIKELPLKYCGFSPCFRSEAGSYGKDTRGLIRLHQFHKVELVNIVEPEKSQEAHENMIEQAKDMLKELELPFRAVLLCSGDTGFSAAKCVDLEVWLPAQNKYREISSLSNCREFQARRADIRYRDGEGRPCFPHTLNGSALAVGRTLLAIMENNQNEDGSIRIPKVLHSRMDMEIIAKF